MSFKSSVSQAPRNSAVGSFAVAWAMQGCLGLRKLGLSMSCLKPCSGYQFAVFCLTGVTLI